MSRKKLVLIDGHSLAYRAFFGLPAEMQTTTGELTNASYGFTSMLLSVLEGEKPDYLIVTFDKGPSFRVREYADYKGHRPQMPDEMRVQMQRVRQIVQAFGFPLVELDDFEADDLLGTLARQAAAAGLDVVIVTGDRDALQLVNERVTVLTSGRKFSDTLRYTPDKVRERYGLDPAQLVDLKALVGDKSDNIPGVAGVGEKGATTFLQQYGSLDALYAHLDELTGRYQKALADGRDSAYLSQKLGRIVCDAPVTLALESARPDAAFNREAVLDLMRTLEFRTLLSRVPDWGKPGGRPVSGQLSLFDAEPEAPTTAPAAIPAGEDCYHLVADVAQLAELAAQWRTASVLAVDTETTGVDSMLADLVGIAVTDRADAAWYLPVRAPEGEPALPLDAIQAELGPLLADPAIAKRGHNLKYDLEILARHGLPVAGPLFDTMLAEWVLNPASHELGLKAQAAVRLGERMTEIETLIGKGRDQITMDAVPLAQVVPYAAADARMTYRLADVLHPELEAHAQWSLFADLEMPLLPILVTMEMHGVKLDVDWLKTLSGELETRLVTLEQEIYAQAGGAFNINSTQQLSEVLFERLHLPTKGVSKTKSGHYSTRADVLDDLRTAHPVVAALLDYRELAKLKSTYVDALPQLVNPHTGRVHTSYNQTGAVTGRLSSANPNLQNIPIRTEEGRRVRRAFIAEEGWTLVGADYSQVELRVMAHMSGDAGLLAAFQRGEDIHATTAAAVYELSLDEVTYEKRRIAKAVNFGLIYGQSAYGLARQVGIEVSEADGFITRYFARFPGLRAYMDAIQKEAATQGYVETLLHRRRYFPELAPTSTATTLQRQAAARMAINTPIQGSAADILKLAMLRLDRMLKERGLRARMILQVHDELVLETPQDEVEATIATLREAMGGAFELVVPLKVDVEIGQNWLEMK
ncbi:MAG TPA: DNA polymerase I [Anaerolineae bacterium]|nr:DNA polymerase I [Anaerolineae bacterium]